MDTQLSSCAEAEPFALRVIGDSMEPEFKDGAIIVIDPAGVIEHGCYVLAVTGEEYIFRQLTIRDRAMFLTPLNDAYPEIPLPGGLNDVKGVIVQQAGRRRRDHRHYT